MNAHARYTFERPMRRNGVRVFNGLGRVLRGLGLTHKLSAEEILDQARQRTGFEDWGDDYFLEPLRLLVQAYEDEAELNSFGRRLIRGLLTASVEDRLFLQQYLRRYPDILESTLSPPLIVVGMPRTGTTLLYGLLSQDPDARPLLGWESLFPVPRGERDNRIKIGRQASGAMRWLAPTLGQIHPFDPDGPEECTWLMANTLVSPLFCMFGHIPSYEEWLWQLDEATWAQAYQDYAAQLLAIQHQRGGRHWVLKSPVHLMSLKPLLDTVTGARVVLTDRDPSEVVPSACSLFAVVRSISSDRIDRFALGAELLEILSKGRRRSEVALAAYPDRVMKVGYRELIQDNTGTVKRIYEHFGLPFTQGNECNQLGWINTSTHAATHKYGLEQFGVTELQIRECFRATQACAQESPKRNDDRAIQ